jgi:two-component system chemotaxis response regulator CheB
VSLQPRPARELLAPAAGLSPVSDSSPQPARVLIVEDSETQRRYLRAAIEMDPALMVLGEARSGREAVALVARLSPTVVLLDLDLPHLNGLDVIEMIMAEHPIPIVVCSAYVTADSGNGAAALAAGAVGVIGKPDALDTEALAHYASEIRDRLRLASRARVITHPRGRLAPGSLRLQPVDGRHPTAPEPAPFPIVCIGASTGGPPALRTVLAGLPADLPAAVVVVQHMADGFLPGLVTWLAEQSPLPVVLGTGEAALQAGRVVVAAGSLDTVVSPRFRLRTRPPTQAQVHVPSVDVTFSSVAESAGPHAVGVLLTGMGRDGALGLAALHRRGAVTLAQDAATSAIFGMPGAAAEAGCVDRLLPLEEIAPAILEAVAALVDRP